MAGIEDETMLDTDVVDLEGNLKGAFPSELRYARALHVYHTAFQFLPRDTAL